VLNKNNKKKRIELNNRSDNKSKWKLKRRKNSGRLSSSKNMRNTFKTNESRG
jgi:hypothetical protein